MMATGLAPVKTPHAIQIACLEGMDAKLEETNELLVIMPTGAGKTWTMGFHLAHHMPRIMMPHVLVLQDRRKVLKQNRETISEATAGIMAKTSVVMGRHNDWSGDIVFGSAATLARPKRLKSMPFLTHILVDEAQDLSPLEIAVAVDTANHLQSVPLAGDVAQPVADIGAPLGSSA